LLEQVYQGRPGTRKGKKNKKLIVVNMCSLGSGGVESDANDELRPHPDRLDRVPANRSVQFRSIAPTWAVTGMTPAPGSS